MNKQVLQKIGIVMVVFVTAVLLGGENVWAAQFSADFMMTDNHGKVSVGKMYVKDDKTRQEMTEEGETTVMILRLDKKLVWTLLPGNQYLELTNPVDPAKPLDIPYDRVTVGVDILNGYSCNVNQYIYKDKNHGVLTQWFAEELQYPIKIEAKSSKGRVIVNIEYQNIKAEQLPDSLFELPSGSIPVSLTGKRI